MNSTPKGHLPVVELTPYGPDEVALHIDVLPHLDHDDKVTVIRSVFWGTNGQNVTNYTVNAPLPVDCSHDMADYLGNASYGNRNRVLYVVACGRCPHMEVRPYPVDPRRKFEPGR